MTSDGVGVRFRALRERRGWSQYDVPGFTKAQVVAWERGRSLPRAQDLVRLADLFGVSTDYLLRGMAPPLGGTGATGSGRGPGDRDAGVADTVSTLVPVVPPDSSDFPIPPLRLLPAGDPLGLSEEVDSLAVVRPPEAGFARLQRLWPGWLLPGDALLLRTVVSATQLTPRRPPPGAWCLLVTRGPANEPEYRMFKAAGSALERLDRPDPGAWWWARDEDGQPWLVVPHQGGAVYEVVYVIRSAAAVAGLEGAAPPQQTVEGLAAAVGVPAILLQSAIGALQEWEWSADRSPPIAAAVVEEDAAPVDVAAAYAARCLAVLAGVRDVPRLAGALRAFVDGLARAQEQASPEPADLVTQTEAGRAIGVSKEAIRQAVERGRIQGYGTPPRVSLREARLMVGPRPGHRAAAVPTPAAAGGTDTADSPLEGVPASLSATEGSPCPAPADPPSGGAEVQEQALPEPEDLVTQAEAARAVTVSKGAINLAVKSGRLHGYGTPPRVSLREVRLLVGPRPGLERLRGFVRKAVRDEVASASLLGLLGRIPQAERGRARRAQVPSGDIDAASRLATPEPQSQNRPAEGLPRPAPAGSPSGGPAALFRLRRVPRRPGTAGAGADVPAKQSEHPLDRGTGPASGAVSAERRTAAAPSRSFAGAPPMVPSATPPSDEAAPPPASAAVPARRSAERPSAGPVQGQRVLLADIIASPPDDLEMDMRARLPEWAPWADAEYDEATYLRYEQDPPPDLPPPWDYRHYDYWEARRSAAHGVQWWEYPEEAKRFAYAHFIRRMEKMYREGDQDLRGKLWRTSRTMYGPPSPLPEEA